MSTKTTTLSAGRPSARSKKETTLASLADTGTTIRVNFDLPAQEHIKLKIYAARRQKTVKELLSEYVASLPAE
jgi:hypothetical protein